MFGINKELRRLTDILLQLEEQRKVAINAAIPYERIESIARSAAISSLEDIQRKLQYAEQIISDVNALRNRVDGLDKEMELVHRNTTEAMKGFWDKANKLWTRIRAKKGGMGRSSRPRHSR